MAALRAAAARYLLAVALLLVVVPGLCPWPLGRLSVAPVAILVLLLAQPLILPGLWTSVAMICRLLVVLASLALMSCCLLPLANPKQAGQPLKLPVKCACKRVPLNRSVVLLTLLRQRVIS